LRARGRAVEAEIVGSRHNDARKTPTGHAIWRASVQDRSQTEPAVANGRQRVTIRFQKISRPRRWFGACIGNRRRRATRPQARHARRHTFIWQRLRANYHSTWGWQWCPALHHGPVLHALRPVHRSIGRLTPHRKRTTQLAADALARGPPDKEHAMPSTTAQNAIAVVGIDIGKNRSRYWITDVQKAAREDKHRAP
jgi:hypothetical protein